MSFPNPNLNLNPNPFNQRRLRLRLGLGLRGKAGGLLLALAVFAAQTSAQEPPPPVQREFRGVWTATVNNIDWPSQRGPDSARQKQELLAILDRAAALRLNVVVFQVRATCDAFYQSRIEPWSEYLTGRMGQPPSPPWDPLQFAVAQAHQRGLELHAWFNPYRARFRNLKTPAAPNHVTLTHPELVRSYGKFLWLDPAEQGTRDYSLAVIMDVVRRYDVDGVHIDDYFYPYPEKTDGRETSFPDDAPWQRYLKQGGKMSRADWRRENVNLFVHAVYQAVKKEKPWVKFGVSPSGIWRASHPPQITGLGSYDDLFGDSRKWLEEGWLDYCAPQLYWPVDQKAHSFAALLPWWAAQNTRHRTLLAGMQAGGWPNVPDEAREVAREIELTRRQPGASGEILWHARLLLGDKNRVAGLLRNQVYSEPALLPASPWLGGNAPGRPILQAEMNRGAWELNWRSAGGAVWQWVLQKKSAGHWTTEILPGTRTGETIKPAPAMPLPETAVLFAVDRFGNMSSAATSRRTQ